MKRVFITIVLLTLAISSFAQEKDVTKFLGIPVDGTKAEMIAKLKEKGFTSTVRDKDILEGEFNGRDVEIMIGTNRDKVWRVIVYDKGYYNESQIKTRFNNLCKQFLDNPKYKSIDQTIPEDEDISYEMNVHDKEYTALFYQHPKEIEDWYVNELKNIIENKRLTEEEKEIKKQELKEQDASKWEHKIVWVKIIEIYGEYLIAIYYENELNQANGEDL